MRIIFLVAFCTMALNAFSQSWKGGTIITTNGDSVRGEINFKDWEISPTEIEYRVNGSSSTSPIKGFKIDEGQRIFEFVSSKIRYYKGVIDFGQDPIESEKIANVFAEVIYSNSAVRLYSIVDEKRNERFLFSESDQGIVELENYSYRVQRDGRTLQSDNPKYRLQLQQLVGDCNVPGISALGYSEREFIKVLDKYAACRGIVTVTKANSESLVNLGAIASIATVPQKLSGVDNYGTVPVIGLSFQVLSRKNFNNRFVHADVGVIAGVVNPGVGFFTPKAYFSIQGGTFIGKGKVQGMIFTGGSRYVGILDTGAGISYQKKLILAASVGLLTLGDGNMFSIKLKYYPRLKAPRLTS